MEAELDRCVEVINLLLTGSIIKHCFDYVYRYKTLLERAQRKHLDSPPTNISSTVNIPNKVTTGPSSGSRQTLDIRDRSTRDLETKLGSFASGLQNTFVSNIAAIKRAESNDSIGSSNSSTPRAAAADPQSLQRSHSNNSITSISGLYSGEKAAHKQSTVQQLKSMLRSKKPALSSLDPYLTDSSETSSQPIPTHTAESAAAALTESDTDGTPGTMRSQPKLFGTEDESYYWSDGSSICARQRDLEGGASTDDAEDYSERSDSSRAPSPIDTASAEQGGKMRRVSTYPGDHTAAAPDSSSGAGAGIASMGIALADGNSNSRESTGTAHSAGSAGSSARLPRRSQSVDSVGSSSNGSAKGKAAPPTAAAVTSPAQGTLRNSSPLSLTGMRAGGGGPQCGEEDSRMSLQLSDDESRSMLFSQLRDDATSDSFYTHSYSYRRPDTAATNKSVPTADGSSGPSSGGIFGMVMSVAANYFPQMMRSSQSPLENCRSSSAAVGAPVAEKVTEVVTHEQLLPGGYISDTMLGEDDDEATMVEPEDDEGACADPEPVLGEPTQQSGAIDSAPVAAGTVSAPEPPVLQLDYSKISPEALAKLSYFESAVKKAKLGRALQSALLCCLVTKQLSPIDGATHIAALLLRSSHQKATPISGTKKSAVDTKGSTDCASSTLLLSTVDKLSKVLTKLFMRNKKIIVADALTVRTICAAGILHITLLLQVYSENPSLLHGQPLRDLAERVTESLERLVHMLNSLFLAAEDAPWLLKWAALPCPEEEGIAHIEQYAHILTRKFSGTAVWSHVRDAVLRCDYTYQRNLISPVKAKPRESRQAAEVEQKRVRKSKGKATEVGTAARECADSEVSALPLFDILTCPSQQEPASLCMLPPRSRASSLTEPVPAAPDLPETHGSATELGKSSSTSASKTTALLEKPKQPTAMEELLQKSRKRKAGSEMLESSREEATSKTGESNKGDGKSSDAAGMPVLKRRNSLLSQNRQQPVGHRMSMGVQKHVVISAKTLAAAAAVSSKLSSVPAATSKTKPLTGNALEDFTKTPRKGISWSPDTPFGSQHEDYQLGTQGSAMRRHVRNTTVVESTPMEAPQSRRPFLLSQQEAAGHNHLADSLCSGGGLHSPEVRSSTRRRRAPSTACSSKSSSSGSGDSADRSSKNNRLSCLFGTQDEDDEEDAAPSLLARSGQQATRSFLSEDSFHYLPSLPSSQEEDPAGGNQSQL